MQSLHQYCWRTLAWIHEGKSGLGKGATTAAKLGLSQLRLAPYPVAISFHPSMLYFVMSHLPPTMYLSVPFQCPLECGADLLLVAAGARPHTHWHTAFWGQLESIEHHQNAHSGSANCQLGMCQSHIL